MTYIVFGGTLNLAQLLLSPDLLVQNMSPYFTRSPCLWRMLLCIVHCLSHLNVTHSWNVSYLSIFISDIVSLLVSIMLFVVAFRKFTHCCFWQIKMYVGKSCKLNHFSTLPVAERIQHKLCLLAYKSILGHTLEYISDLLTTVANIPGRSTLCASSCGNLVVPRTRRRTGDRAFYVAAPQAWNRLLMELKLLWSTDSFHRDLKTFLFHSVYGHQDMDWLCDAHSVFY